MNREIKFRAWLDGSFKKDIDLIPSIIEDRTEYDSYKEVWIYFGVEGIPQMVENHIDYSLVHQYTGLKDKNGVDIYDGDIVNYEILGVIVEPFIISWGGWCYVRMFVRDNDNVHEFDIECSKRSVVIGNIYENPELLNN